MRKFKIVPIPSDLAERVRRTRRDKHGSVDLTPTIVHEPHSAPCRLCLQDAAVGDAVLLLGYSPFETPQPYRTVGPIFVHAEPCAPFRGLDADGADDGVPAALRRRLLSVRSHDHAGRMRDADVTPGEGLAELATRLFADEEVQELHVHHARPGCFACRIVRS
jgi:hypothetical protein